jgi:hypothetical protein
MLKNYPIRKKLNKAFFKFIAAFTFAASTSLGLCEDLSSCTLKKTSDEQNFCKASFAGSGTFCDMIKNGEKKRECHFMVIKLQRSNAYQIKKYEAPKPE